MTDKFWDEVVVPFNPDIEAREDGYEFINPVTVAEHFAEITQTTARLAQQYEDGSTRLSELEQKLRWVTGDLNSLRKRILAANFEDVTRTARPEIQDAFILHHAPQEVADQIEEFEAEIGSLEDEIEVVKAALKKIHNRMKLIEKNMDYAKQYLDHEKLLARVEMQRNRT